jgi:hypothetical protein
LLDYFGIAILVVELGNNAIIYNQQMMVEATMEHILVTQISPISQDANGIVEFLKAIAPVLGGAIGAILGAVATQFFVSKQRRIRAIAERINNMELAYSKLLARMTSFKAAHDNYRVSIGKIIINNQLPKTYRDKEGNIDSFRLGSDLFVSKQS